MKKEQERKEQEQEDKERGSGPWINEDGANKDATTEEILMNETVPVSNDIEDKKGYIKWTRGETRTYWDSGKCEQEGNIKEERGTGQGIERGK